MNFKNLNLRSCMMVAVMLGMMAACDNQQGATEDGAVVVDGVNEPAPTPVEALDEGLAEERSAILQRYVVLKDALFNDNPEGARQAAADLQNSLEGPDAANISEARKTEMMQSASSIAQAQDIEKQREQFASLSNSLYQVVKNRELTDENLYWQHCPMAMGGKGANWLSMQEQIQNPYMGQSMPRCGSVQETL